MPRIATDISNCSVFIATALLLCSLPGAAHAEETGFEAGLRFGVGVPLGKVSDDEGSNDLSDGISLQFPLWLDLGYRVHPNVFVGLYGQYGFGVMGDTFDEVCDASSQIDCSTSVVRLGIQGQYRLRPQTSVDPWLGVGFGYEWLNIGIEAAAAEASYTISGFEFLNLQAGVDFAAAEHVYLGGFISFSLGVYSDVSTDCSGPLDCSELIEPEIEETLHEWFVIGVRGGFAP